MVGMWAVFAAGSSGGGAVDGFRRKRLFAVLNMSSYGERGAYVLAVTWGLSVCMSVVYVRCMRRDLEGRRSEVLCSW
jgi:hypothetical protein